MGQSMQTDIDITHAVYSKMYDVGARPGNHLIQKLTA
jgi:hypothetical protein